MKNIALIKSIVATSISSANPAELTEHIAALIQAHPEETRENALAILTGTAELTVRPVDQVELTCNSSNYTNLSFMGEPTVNLLEGTVCCSINYTRTETRWYKTEEDANARRNGSYNHDDYVIARDMWAGVIKKGLWALSLIAFAMDDRTQRVADEIASIEAISHNTVKALSTVTTPLNVIVEMYIAGLEAKLQALRALVK